MNTRIIKSKTLALIRSTVAEIQKYFYGVVVIGAACLYGHGSVLL